MSQASSIATSTWCAWYLVHITDQAICLSQRNANTLYAFADYNNVHWYALVTGFTTINSLTIHRSVQCCAADTSAYCSPFCQTQTMLINQFIIYKSHPIHNSKPCVQVLIQYSLLDSKPWLQTLRNTFTK